MTVTVSKKEIKLSTPASTLFTKLRSDFLERVTEPKSSNELNYTPDQLNDFLDGYTTQKLSDGKAHSVSAIDIEKVAQFREDLSQANRLLTNEQGFDLFETDKESDRFMLTVNLTPNLRFASSVYRPTEDGGEGAAEEFTAITDHGSVSKDSKAITEHLASLRADFLKS